MASNQLHPDPEMQSAASEGGHTLQQFMDSLNNNEGIYLLLDAIKSDDAVFGTLSDEERYIVDVSLLELRLASSIEKDDGDRDRIQRLRREIGYKEDEFYRLCHDVEEQRVSVPDGSESVAVDHRSFATAMRHWDSAPHRRAMFDAFYAHSAVRCRVLQSLREHRHDLARSVGFDSLAALRAQSSLFEGNVRGIECYLLNLAASMRAQCVEEVEQLRAYSEGGLKLWDFAFAKRMDFEQNGHGQQSKDAQARISEFERALNAHLSMEQCLQSLQRLMAMAFDLELDRCPFGDDGILRFELKRPPPSGELLGVLYLDLFERANKAHSECITYPLLCGATRCAQSAEVVLSMNLSDAVAAGTENVSHHQLAALYHEFGHALHSLLSRTEHQTLSGPRGLCMEFMEFPSSFLEHFVFDEHFLKFVVMDNQMAEGMVPPQDVLESMRRPHFAHIQSMQQIYDSLLDLALFGDGGKQRMSMEEAVQSVYRELAVLMGNERESELEDALHGHLLRASRFYHFIDYPASYHCYVTAQQMSRRIWQRTFGCYAPMEGAGARRDDRAAFEHWKGHLRHYGQRLRDDVLVFGSARPPTQCLHDFAGSDVEKLY